MATEEETRSLVEMLCKSNGKAPLSEDDLKRLVEDYHGSINFKDDKKSAELSIENYSRIFTFRRDNGLYYLQS